MKETIYNLLAQQGDMTWQQIIMHILVSAVIGLFIFISYVISHKGTIYSKKFGVTLIVLTVMTGTVMTVIGNNIALSLGMVGALSIVRNKRFQRYCIYFLDDYCGNMLWSWRLSGCCSRQFCYFSYFSYHGSDSQ